MESVNLGNMVIFINFFLPYSPGVSCTVHNSKTVLNWLIRNYEIELRNRSTNLLDEMQVCSLLICILFQSESEWLLWMWKLICSPPSSDLLVPLQSFWLCFVTPGTPTQWSRPELERFLSRPYFSSRGMSTRASWWTLMEQVSHTIMLLFTLRIVILWYSNSAIIYILLDNHDI